jgi:hypothetical protein
VGQEIGSEVYTHYYAQYETAVTSRSTPAPVFDANAALRDIRRQVDAYLAAGQIDQAESYMDQQQQYLAGQGYYIRKLNQAYFAFYGTYADSGTSIDPTGAQLKSLRAHSLSIKDFLAQAANLTSAADLKTLINQLK